MSNLICRGTYMACVYFTYLFSLVAWLFNVCVNKNKPIFDERIFLCIIFRFYQAFVEHTEQTINSLWFVIRCETQQLLFTSNIHRILKHSNTLLYSLVDFWARKLGNSNNAVVFYMKFFFWMLFLKCFPFWCIYFTVIC